MREIFADDKGFTLIEALIAMFVLSIGILGVLAMQTSAVRYNYRASTMTRASSVVAGQIEQIRRQSYSGLVTGSSVDAATGYTVNWTVGNLLDSSAVVVSSAKLVTVSVAVPNNGPVVRYEYVRNDDGS